MTTNTPSINVEVLYQEIQSLDTTAKACIALDCIVQHFSLCPDHISLNYSRFLDPASDRIVEMFEEDLLCLTGEQRQWLARQLSAQLWGAA